MLELNLVIANAEGALVRLLGTIERRGFRIAGIQSEPDPQGTRLHLQLPADSRPADVLLRQLRRLVDVREAGMDIVRPEFQLPAAAVADSRPSAEIASRQRRGMSFLGIPERVSSSQVGFA